MAVTREFRLTLAHWRNTPRRYRRAREPGGTVSWEQRWVKAFSRPGPVTQYERGTVSNCGQPCHFAPPGTPLPAESQACQLAVICAPHTGVLIADCDDAAAWAGNGVGLGRADAWLTRGERFHVVVDMRAVPGGEWPTQGPVAGGDVKALGFAPVPGSTHWTGQAYAPVMSSGGELRVVAGTPELAARLRRARDEWARSSRRREAGGGGGGGGEPSAAAAGGNEPALMSRTSRLWEQFGAAENGRERAWEEWLAFARSLPLSDPGWPWTEDDRDIFERHWKWYEENAEPAVSAVVSAWVSTAANAVGNAAANAVDNAASTAAGNDGVSGGITAPPGGGALELPGESDDREPTPWERVIPWPGYRLPAEYDQRTASGIAPQGDHHGIFRREERDDGQGGGRGGRAEVAITVTPLAVSEICVDDDGNEMYELRWLSKRGEVSSSTVAAIEIADSRRLPSAFGGELVVISRRAGDASEYLQLLIEENREELSQRITRVARQLGWQGTELSEFAFGDGRPHRVRDDRNTGRWLLSHRKSGTLQEWKSAVWVCASRPLPLLLLAASLAAPLLRVTGARSFTAGVDGGSTGGKTTAIRLAASVWGYPQDGYLIRSWDDTGVSHEHHAAMLRGIPFFLDETQHAVADPAKVRNFVYALSQGHSRSRSNQQGTQTTGDAVFETIALTSGEKSLAAFTSHGGALARVVTMNGQPMASAEMAGTVERTVLASYGHAGEVMVSAIRGYPAADLTRRWHHLAESLRSSATTHVQGRRADSIALMWLAAEVAAAAGIMPALGPDAWHWLVQGGESLDEHDDDVPMKALMLLGNHVTASSRSFWRGDRRDRGIMDMMDVEPPQGWAGRYQAGEYLSVRPEWLRELLSKHGIDWDSVKGQWRDRGWLRTPGGKRASALTISETIQGSKAMCVRIICPELLDTLVTGMLE